MGARTIRDVAVLALGHPLERVIKVPVGKRGSQMTHVLVVDDDGPTREMLRDVLEDEGYDVATAADGLAALE
jgi:PleD family two-component response regulator